MPPTLGTKIIPIGPSRDIICASCPAPLGSRCDFKPSLPQAASIDFCTSGVASASS
jgi:hypothetical protein